MKTDSGQITKEQSTPNHLATEFHRQHQKLNQETEQRYNALTYFEREDVIRWLKNNLSTIPILAKTKNTGMQEITAGHIESNSALLLIRHALQALQL